MEKRKTSRECIESRDVCIESWFDAAIHDLAVVFKSIDKPDSPNDDLAGNSPREAVQEISALLAVMQDVLCGNESKNKKFSERINNLLHALELVIIRHSCRRGLRRGYKV